MSVPALLHGFILREIDVTLIKQYFQPYLRLKLHILSGTLLLQGCYRLTGLSRECPSSVTRVYLA